MNRYRLAEVTKKEERQQTQIESWCFVFIILEMYIRPSDCKSFELNGFLVCRDHKEILFHSNFINS